MRIFIAGATGVVGRRLVPLLCARGHQVTAMTRSHDKRDALARAGARPVVVDALDEPGVIAAVAMAEPHVVVHQLTDLAKFGSPRRFEQAFASTNRLRTQATDHLMAAASATGAQRFVAQSFVGWTYARDGGPVKTEDDPLDPNPLPAQRTTLDAIEYLERVVTGAPDMTGVVLRYGCLYGPGTSLGPGGEHFEAIRRRRFHGRRVGRRRLVVRSRR
jgi:2-alkyl-3-oxoalkanoate reductase